MTQPSGSTEDSTRRIVGEFITALVLLTHGIVFFQIVICSKNMVVAFNIPTKNIGIYLSKLYSLRSLLMSVGAAFEYSIYKLISEFAIKGDKVKGNEIRKYMSITSFTCLAITRFIFLIFLYYPETASFRNYIVLNIGAFFVGSFQISAFSLTPEFSALSWLSVYLSGIFAFVVQAIMDLCWSKRPSLTFKIQSWISLILSIASVGLWLFYLFWFDEVLKKTETTKEEEKQKEVQCQQKDRSLQLSLTLLLSKDVKSIVVLLIDELKILCGDCNCEKTSDSIRLLITDLSVITCPEQITDSILVTIDLVRIGLSRLRCCTEPELLRLRILAFVLRQKQAICISTGIQIQVTTTIPLGTCTPTQQPAVQTDSNNQEDQSLYEAMSPFFMYASGSLIKDFLFPGVIPYGLLDRDKCHLINLIVIVFLSVGPITIFVLNKQEVFNDDKTYIHLFWSSMIPEIIIFFISLSAIHTKQSSTHKIRSSRWRVFLMAMILLLCYGFLETVNIVGVPTIAKGSFRGDLIAINNIFGKFFRYFVYKLSVGYNKTRIGAGFVLPNFKPPEPIPNTFGFWFKGAFSNGGKDLASDFKMGIKQYLTVAEEPIVKSVPILSSVYPDLLR